MFCNIGNLTFSRLYYRPPMMRITYRRKNHDKRDRYDADVSEHDTGTDADDDDYDGQYDEEIGG
ncbi:MAG: hypothetical protein ACLVKJ_07605 [Acutalibacteraceae bacterium]|jgi:hypothetical protein